MRKPIHQRLKIGPRKPTEAQLSQLIRDFLKLDGWRVFRMEPLSNVIQQRYSAELGCPDILALRYAEPHRGRSAAILWIEVKVKGRKPAKHQALWHDRERALGAEVVVVDDFEEFKAWYVNSGFNRGMRA